MVLPSLTGYSNNSHLQGPVQPALLKEPQTLIPNDITQSDWDWGGPVLPSNA